ncbi:NADP-dependent oxidoreductase [Paramicrobacterium agarici]|uniref:NADPH:quinone reductase-like Zn-dependent oxidoreductase n=1 Tax=Paramicrobacterium agarici TaxID=630514 RepID=A0A2A9DUC9_9MICO|nr:NADP-dependent oxidoreductase [Microbacterium agarici]PFG29582.1 NADPH:quinone reductase-like Zn-dependent oxidoreductase [Microbacterium agarici]TQO22587.1 NADPH:quinone reductase-like Zn-dependent oxidoreductase [Microbacterium agarici]
MNRAVIYEKFGGPEVLDVKETPEPHAAPGEVRVRVTAAGLNPMDWIIASLPEAAEQWGVTLPAGFGCDFAGVIDEVGPGAGDFVVGDRVFGGVMARAVADHVIVNIGPSALWPLARIPEGMSDETAAALPTPGLTAAAVVDTIGLGPDDTVLLGGAAGGVGVLTVQLAKLAGARVIGTASEGTFDFLRTLGAEPVTYGPGLADRVRELAPNGVTAAADLFGSETVEAALELGVAKQRITWIAAGESVPDGIRWSTGSDAAPGSLEKVARAIVAGEITVPIAARFGMDDIRDAVALQAERHVHGKIVVIP